MTKKVRHVLGLSGGKDSAALAIYMRDKVPEMEYFFSDTGKELPEVYNFLNRLEVYLGKEIVHLEPERDFDHYLVMHNGLLPSRDFRWCTVAMKIKPFERFVGDDQTISYIGIRADEDNRKGYISRKPNIKPVFPFKEDGIVRADVFNMLKESGLGVPEYYEWRSRSGCFFCFFQRKDEWVGLAQHYPELFQEAMRYEQEAKRICKETGDEYTYTWSKRESLKELIARSEEILTRAEKRKQKDTKLSWQEQMTMEEDDKEQACIICSL